MIDITKSRDQEVEGGGENGGGHGNPETNDEGKSSQNGEKSSNTVDKLPDSCEESQRNANLEKGDLSPGQQEGRKSEPGNSDNNNKVHVVSVEITPENKSRMAADKVGGEGEDTVVCIVAKKGSVAKQDSIKFIDESPTSPVASDNKDFSIVPEETTNKMESLCEQKESAQPSSLEKRSKENDATVSVKSHKVTSAAVEIKPETKPVGEECRNAVANDSGNKDRAGKISSVYGSDKCSASEKDALLKGAKTNKSVVASDKSSKAFVVEDMSNVDETMPITKL